VSPLRQHSGTSRDKPGDKLEDRDQQVGNERRINGSLRPLLFVTCTRARRYACSFLLKRCGTLWQFLLLVLLDFVAALIGEREKAIGLF
jgi:hypothetical protein